MTKRDTKRRRSRNRAAAVGAARRAACGAPAAQPKAAVGAKEAEKTGLRWLMSKGRLTKAQCMSGIAYGACYRIVQMKDAGQPIKSCLDIEPRGGSGAGLPTSSVETMAWIAEATTKLETARATLGNHAGMIGVCDLICGQQLTPREITTKQREADEIETTLRLALDLLTPVFDHGKATRSLEDALRRADALEERAEQRRAAEAEAERRAKMRKRYPEQVA